MLAAVVKVSGVIDQEIFLNDMVASFKKKFAKKPDMIEGNIAALNRAMKEVKVS